ncbi:hypothetical protein QFC24_003157 [Naganishia onofrii]|uniref:Uncharacterized protein n=1 Tax=Naganishia onofrii TaxID=1851511 RepID=A0ACC2XMD8_9TREE|nr:hypothetical protein QFC24_003157 [Naganishia onofrii]
MTDLAQFNAGNDHAAADDDDDELQQFREQWRQEVESRKRQQQQQRQQPVTAAGVYPVKKPEQQHPMPTTTTLSEQNITADETVERSSSFKESRNQLRPRPRGILDAERSEDQMIKTGILQDEVELARAVAAVGRIQLGGGLVAAAVEGKGKEKSATTANVVYPSTTQQGKSGKQQQTHGKPISGSTTTTASTEKQQPLSPKLKHAQPVAIATDKSNRIKDHPTTNVNTNTNTKKAVEAYTRAVDLESSGQLNEALHLYRKAYKLDDLVDKAYNTAIRNMEERDRLRAQVSREEIQVVDPKEVTVTATPPPLEPYVFMTHTQLAPDYHSPLTSVASTRVGGGRLASADTHAEWTDPLTRIISRFVSQDQEDQAQHLYALDFTPEEEKWPCLLGILPDEVVENIVFFLDVQSLERFAVTCKKARLVTRVAPVWK